MREHLAPLSSEVMIHTELLDRINKELPDQNEKMSVVLSRLQKLDKVVNSREEKLVNMNKLLTGLFAEVADLDS